MKKECYFFVINLFSFLFSFKFTSQRYILGCLLANFVQIVWPPFASIENRNARGVKECLLGLALGTEGFWYGCSCD